MLAYYGYFGRARAERIRGIQDQLEHLALRARKDRRGNDRGSQTLEQQRSSESRRLQSSRRTAGPGGEPRSTADQDAWR